MHNLQFNDYSNYSGILTFEEFNFFYIFDMFTNTGLGYYYTTVSINNLELEQVSDRCQRIRHYGELNDH
jgi:hypothetical protein